MPDGRDPSADPEQLTQEAGAVAKATQTIGPYRLLQRLGEGGMGEVWLAEQTRPVHRQVALKVIKAGMDTAQVVARFEAERQALALMDHPAIARVFDAGATPQGRPYFVMEFVRGESVTAYAIRHHMPLRDRIELFMQVCEGVQHAHQKGIIHRDLKPSNILVTIRVDHPVPKIIDFGVAKAMTQSLTERTLYTEIGALVGTPEYMSPEQAEIGGVDIDTRTDVYSLGVILYELLTGTLPFESKALREQSLDNLRQTIREVDPPRPSTRVTTAAGAAIATSPPHADASRLARQLRGDLDWITMKALEKDRTRRYGSVSDLAADLRRHLDDVAVLASPPSVKYRVGKFVRRHRSAVAAAGALILLLVVFAAVMAVQAGRIARARDRASQEAATAKQVSEFLVGLFKVSDPSEARGTTLTAREILAKGAQQLDNLRDQPVVQARLQATIGAVDTGLGLYNDAQPLLARALQTQKRVAGEDSPETLATTHSLANLYWYIGRYDDAEPLYLAVVGARSRLLGEEHRDTLRAEFDLASLYVLQKRWEVAEALLRRTLEAQQRKLGEADLDSLESLHTLASFYYRIERYEESLPISVKVVQLRTRILGESHPDTLQSMHNLATTYEALRRYDDAEPLYLRTIDIRRQVLGDEHPELANTRFTLARLFFVERRYAESEQLALTAYPPMLRSVGPTHDRTVRIAKLLAQLYDSWHEPAKAAEWRAKLPKDAASKP